MKSVKTYLCVAVAALCALTSGSILSSCTGKNDSSQGVNRLSEIESSDSIPESVKAFVKAVVTDDSIAFASLVSYPLERPYPLSDILDSAQMVSYYRVLVDDSLKHTVATAGPEDWDEVGWRGWMLKDGSYVWIDENVYSINYLSGREVAMLKNLVEEEKESLHQSLRGDITPVGCYTDEGGKVYRIDMINGKNPETYRLCVYNDATLLRDKPSEQLLGTMLIEGSAGTQVYTFGNKGEITALLEPYQNDREGQQITITRGDSEQTTDLKAAAWLSLIK